MTSSKGSSSKRRDATGMESSLQAGRVKRANDRTDGAESAETEALHQRTQSAAATINSDLTQLIDKMHDAILDTDASGRPAGNLFSVWWALKAAIEPSVLSSAAATTPDERALLREALAGLVGLAEQAGMNTHGFVIHAKRFLLQQGVLPDSAPSSAAEPSDEQLDLAADAFLQAKQKYPGPGNAPLSYLLRNAFYGMALPQSASGTPMWLIKFDGVPQAAYSRKIQAEVYASGFSHPDKTEVIEGAFVPADSRGEA